MGTCFGFWALLSFCSLCLQLADANAVQLAEIRPITFNSWLYGTPSGVFNPAAVFSPQHGWIMTFRWDRCFYLHCGVLHTQSTVRTTQPSAKATLRTLPALLPVPVSGFMSLHTAHCMLRLDLTASVRLTAEGLPCLACVCQWLQQSHLTQELKQHIFRPPWIYGYTSLALLQALVSITGKNPNLPNMNLASANANEWSFSLATVKALLSKNHANAAVFADLR